MDHAELAKKIRAAIYNRSDEEGGAISREQMENAIEGALIRFAPANSWVERPAPGIKVCDGSMPLTIHGIVYHVPVLTDVGQGLSEVADAVTWMDVG